MNRGSTGLAFVSTLVTSLLCVAASVVASEDTHEIVHPRPPTAEPKSEVKRETLERLEALGYAEWTDVELAGSGKKVGVVTHDVERAYGSLNLYKSRPRHDAHLMDMQGRILHTWRAPDPSAAAWDFVELLPDGSLFGSAKYERLEKLDWNSKLLWSVPVGPHHDLDIGEDGRVYVLTEERRELSIDGDEYLIRDNDITILSPEGVVERQVRLSDLFSDLVPKPRLKKIQRHRAKQFHGDVFHANSIELLDRDVPGVGRRGSVLVSIRELDLIAVLDLDPPRVVWSWGPGILDAQHHPSLLSDGRMLIFDNGRARHWSRVLELAPNTKSLTWELRGEPKSSLYTPTRGSAERLPNGNTLVVESGKGRVFEVTRSGEIVWDFFNPDIIETKGKRHRANIYRMPRLPRPLIDQLPLKVKEVKGDVG
ncbi:MAG: arylsulfotransferase family protein [Candidatus Binatia bacterium]|nr:arylsulfotransferase family protein [Candidatus Binatia bacterium]